MMLRGTKTIVSIDDDEGFGKLLRLMLKPEDVEVVHATNGREGLRIVENLVPDLVVLDLMMPDMHGWEIFEQMQSRPELREIPVIVVTALSSETDLSMSNVLGVDAYLVKPVRSQEFRTTVVEALKRRSENA